MRLGVFGGTFDPPHLGHLILASEACYSLQLDQVLWVVTSHPPHKKDQIITPIRYRVDMVSRTLSAEPFFALSLVEVERPGPHYVVDTMRIMRERYPQVELIYLMGGDSLHDLPNWYRPREFLSNCDKLGVMRRPQDEINMDQLEAELIGISEKVQFIPTPLIEISSQDIRARIREKRPFRYFLPEAVYQYILENKLYRGKQ